MNALLIDVLPTTLDLIAVDLPDDRHVDGESLVGPAFDREPNDKPIHPGSGPRSVPGDFSAVLPSARRNAVLADDGEVLEGTEQVLIAVDGILAGIGDLNPSNGEFIALLDEQRLTPGAHEIDLYVPGADGSIRRVEAD